MDSWDLWTRDEEAQNASDSNHQALTTDDIRRQLLVRQLQQNFENSQPQSLGHYLHYNNGAAPDPLAATYPFQSRQEEEARQLLGNFDGRLSQGSLQHQTQQQQHLLSALLAQSNDPFNIQSNDPFNIDALGARESVARHPSLSEDQQRVSLPPHASTNSLMASLHPNHPLVAPTQSDRAAALLNPTFHMPAHGQGGDTLQEPAQKRRKSEDSGGSLLSMALGGHSALATSGERVREDESGEAFARDSQRLPAFDFRDNEETHDGARHVEPPRHEERNTADTASSTRSQDNGTSEKLNDLIDGLFADDPSRDSYATDGSAAAAFQSDTNNNLMAAEYAEPGTSKRDGGIFDDAEDDFELPNTFQYPASSAPPRPMEAIQVAPNRPTSAAQPDTNAGPVNSREDGSKSGDLASSAEDVGAVAALNDDAFEDAADDPTIKAVEAATSGVKPKAHSKPKRKRKVKPRPPLSKPIAAQSPKEKTAATSLLNGMTDLTLVLPENACRLLAKEFWIFTAQQFEHVFATQSADPDMNVLRGEIRDAVARQPLDGDESVESSNDSNSGLKPIGVEKLLVVSRDVDKVHCPAATTTEQDSAKVFAADASYQKVTDDLVLTMDVDSTKNGNDADAAAESTVSTLGGDSTANSGAQVMGNSGDSHGPTNGCVDVEMKESQSDPVPTKSDDVQPQEAPLVTTGDSTDKESSLQIDASLPPKDSNSSALDGVSSQTLVGDTTVAVVSDEKRATAERILESWVNRLAKWKRVASAAQSEEESLHAFSLKGPAGVLIPQIIHNFLSSISVSTVHEFLSIRFTEASSPMQGLVAWRKLCGLESVKPENLARHMGGLATRLRTALSSVPPADAYKRKWMGTALACLTAASKEFLIDQCKLQSPEEFLDGRTSDFSDKLVAWRESKKKSVLKGSGRVAMISSFKAQVRDSVAAQETRYGTGRVCTEDEIIEVWKTLSSANTAEEGTVSLVTNEKPAKKRKEKSIPSMVKKRKQKELPTLTESQRQKAESVLKSTEFLEKVLQPENVQFLARHNIFTAEQLINADRRDDSTLVADLVKWRKETTGTDVLNTSCRRLLSGWSTKVSDKVKRVATGELDGEVAKIPAQQPQKPQVAKSSASSTPKRARKRSNKSFDDPIETLSSTALTFLKTLGITTGDEFLSTRTSEMANAFLTWREENKMVALKGSGHSATVSGWKAAVRKAAESVENEDSLAEDMSAHGVPKISRPRKRLLPPKPTIDHLTHPNLLGGLSRRKFCVQSTREHNRIYEFELSVRKSGKDLDVHLTYLGAKEVPSDGGHEGEGSMSAPSQSTCTCQPTSSFLPVLQDVNVSSSLPDVPTDTFVASHPGCGLIEVSRYGAIPLPKEDRIDVSSQIQQFLLNDHLRKERTERQQESGFDCRRSNVLVEVSPEFGSQCFFYAAEPLEKGQTVELRFSPCLDKESKESMTEPFDAIVDRMAIARKVSALSLAELKVALDQMSKLVDSYKMKVESTETEQSGGCHPQIVRRRVHWLASQIVRGLGEKEERSGEESQRRALAEDAKKLLMTMDDCRSLYTYSKQLREESILSELSQEILCNVVMNNALGRWSERSSWCKMSTNLWRECLRKASVHLLTSWSGGNESRQDLLKELDDLVFDAVKRVISWDRDLKELAFEVRPERNAAVSRVFFLENYDRLPKDVVATASQEEAYENAIELCDEIPCNTHVKAALHDGEAQGALVIATRASYGQNATIVRSIGDVEKENAQIDVRWYIENQILSVAHAIASSDLLPLASSKTDDTTVRPDCSYSRFAGVARRILEADPTDDRRPSLERPDASSDTGEELKNFPLVPADLPVNTAVPSTLPLFLAVVWPRLKNVYGFCIGVGDDPDDVTFFPPGHKGQFQLASERQVGLQRLKRSRKRLKVMQQVRGVGFGDMTKLTKRMFISATRDDLKPGDGTSVKDALKQFVAAVLSELPGGNDEECRQRMTAIEDAVSTCFDELIPSMLPDNGDSTDSSSAECAYLMQVLLVLPSLLEQSGLSMRRIEDTLGVIRELAQFVATKNGELFAKPLQLCPEKYEVGHDAFQPFLLPRLKKIASKRLANAEGAETKADDNADPEFIREVVNPEDLQELSGFIGTVLSQFIPCRATEIDVMTRTKKGIYVGYPGMLCRHCASKGTEGRYFFTSLDSLNTAATATLGHVYKCPYIPDELKKRIESLKTRHAEERKALKHGAQAHFFARLWKRLWSTQGIAMPVFLENHRNLGGVEEEGPIPTKPSSEDNEAALPSLEFKSHTDLLNYLTSTPPWSNKADIRERIKQYYDCVAYGGEIYNTNVMPKNFHSEYILAQMVPPERLSNKRIFRSG